MAIEITRDAAVVVRVPHCAGDEAVQTFVGAHRDWIARHQALRQAYLERNPEPTAAERQALIAKANDILPGRVAHYGAIMGLSPTGLRITNARGRFGSCSAKNRLCFSWLLMRYDDAAIDYVVVHELAHILHKNHGAEFYRAVEAVLPDYRARIRLLREF
ncbi:MAG: M48 family metallopeptidase [Oscillospiraceae bacterium]|nr:M48 family metallopeptidase [Oscillospiraceae bacterium]